MKKLTTLLAAAVILFVMSGKAQAVPMYYTFEGYVSYVNNDPTGAIANAGLSLYSAVTYTFIVDLDADGTYTRNDGTVSTYTDTASQNYFYADYVSGDALAQVDGGYRNADGNPAEFNYGSNCLTRSCSRLAGNSADDPLLINWSWWANGRVYDTVTGNNRAYDSTGAFSFIRANLALTDVSPVNAVPEPSTLLLLASGMLGLFAFRRRQLTTQA